MTIMSTTTIITIVRDNDVLPEDAPVPGVAVFAVEVGMVVGVVDADEVEVGVVAVRGPNP